jgi:hypothetical protein
MRAAERERERGRERDTNFAERLFSDIILCFPCLSVLLAFGLTAKFFSASNKFRSVIIHAPRRNNSLRCPLRRLPRPQDAGTPSNSTRILVIWVVTYPSTMQAQCCLTLVIN